jgi:hypothetical protein
LCQKSALVPIEAALLTRRALQSLADDALNSFVIINAALQRSSALAEYTGRRDVQARMGEAFRVGMGFGLHTGCASMLHAGWARACCREQTEARHGCSGAACGARMRGDTVCLARSRCGTSE